MADAQASSGEGAKLVVDAVAAGTTLGALVGILPAIAAIFTIVWTGIRIYETDTVQSLIGRKAKKDDGA